MRHRRITSDGIITAILWATVVLLSALGVFAAYSRGVAVTHSYLTRDQSQPSSSRTDRRNLELVTAIVDVQPGSTRFDELHADFVATVDRYNAHPMVMMLHVGPGLLILVLAPLQLSSRIRRRHITLHRWSGRVILAVGVPLAASGFFFGWKPVGGAGESAATVTFGALFLFAATRGFIAIRRRDVAHHREWMIRMFSIALGISTIRILDLVLLAVTEARPRDLVGPSFWIGWLLTLGVAELWIRIQASPLPAEGPWTELD